MKYKVLASVAISALAFSFMRPAPVAMAQTYGLSYVTSITYQNLTSTTANVTFTFYAENTATSAATVNRTVAGNAASSLGVGSVSGISAGFKGSTVMASDQPVAATLVQVPPGSATSKNRLLSNGFSGGSSTVLVGTVLKAMFGQQQTSVISMQNTDSVANDITIKYYVAGSATPLYTRTYNAVPAGAAVYADAGTEANLGSTFNGSAVVTAIKTGSANLGSVVATVLELDAASGKTDAAAFEGVSGGATTAFMPSALCKFSGQLLTVFFAVQNTNTSQTATITATYYDLTGTQISTEQRTAAPNGKTSFNSCTVNATGFTGSAKLTSDQPIIVIGKARNDAALGKQGISTAFLGVTQGYTKLALPYIRWANDANNVYSSATNQRAFITIQNVGSAPLTGNIVVKYYDAWGAISSTHTIAVTNLAVGAKVNSNPRLGLANPTDPNFQFGYYGSTFGGSAVIEGPAGSQLGVVVRLQNATDPALGGSGQAGEDYNGVPVP